VSPSPTIVFVSPLPTRLPAIPTLKTSIATNKNVRILVITVVVLAVALAIRLWHDLGASQKPSFSDLQRRVQEQPNDFQAQLDWGNALHALHRDTEAEAAYKTAASLAPTDAQPLDLLATLAMERQRPDQALEYLQASLKLDPNDAHAWHSYAQLLERMDPRAAMQAYARATQLDPKDAFSWRQLGILERGQNRDRALQDLQRAAALNPNDLITEDMIGDTALASGKIPLAQQAYDRALAIQPNDPQALLGTAHRLLLQDPSPANLAKAGPLIDRAFAGMPQPSGYAYLVRGQWNLLQRRYPQAVSDLKAALDSDPSMYTAHISLSQAYAALGKPQLARRESDLFVTAHDRAPAAPGSASTQGQSR